MKNIGNIFFLMILGLQFLFAIPVYSSFHSNNPPLIAIRLNNGSKYTNKKEISVEIKSLKIEDKQVAEMQFGLLPNLSDGIWMPYSLEKKTLALTGEDGQKTVYVRLKDKAGNLSPIESAEIILDTTPPSNCNIAINNGEEFTNNRQMKVGLKLSATEANKMQLSNSPNFERAIWENYAENKLWIIAPPGDGKKTVYIRFMDVAQNISPTVESSIILDTQPPKNCSIVINNNDKFTRTTQVNLKVAAEDAAKVMLVDRLGKTEILEFEEGKSLLETQWEFDSLQGVKTIKALFVDKVGNKTTLPVSDDIIFDSHEPPPPIVQINNGAKFTNDPNGKVSLKITSRVAPASIKMQVSNQDDFAGSTEMSFSAALNWQLDHSQDGLKSVYVRFVDEAGNFSQTSKTDIHLDREKPVIQKLAINNGSEFSISSKVKVQIEAEDAAFMQIGSTEAAFKTATWEPFKNIIDQYQLPVGDGEKYVYVRLKDEAENVSAPMQAKIFLDTKPPVGEITINNKSKFTNNKDKKIDLQLKVDDAVEMQLSESVDFQGVDWQPVTNEISGYILKGEDGAKAFYLKLKDKAGNTSNVASTSIVLDRTAPEDNRLLVNNGARWLNNPTKRVTLSMASKGGSEVMIAHSPSFEGAKWIPLTPTLGWTFEGDDGVKKVFAKFKDDAGNVSQVVEASIKLDTQAPELLRFYINNNSQFTNHKDFKVTLSIKSKGADFMTFSNHPIEKPDNLTWSKFSELSEWQLDGEEGARTVFMMLKDSAGNVTPAYSANIIYDKTAPQGGKILINNNEKYTNHPEKRVSLLIGVNHSSEMMISNTSDFKDAKWEPFKSKKENWILPGEDGEKTVYAKLKDEAGNVSEIISDHIVLDRKPPVNPKISIIGNPIDESKTIKLKLMALEAKSMIISQYNNFTNAKWEDFSSQKDFVLNNDEGEITIYVKFKDEAGNETPIVSEKIILNK